ncbi:hypothetical protein AVEN_267099-1 [Araneus ventricosus]|uniref:Uncharacterized protein n=1 Tax=Araneus ventricosus TaxID=182803 RepID=A0A4Y2T257_ARAVE|nr:hypothetical protein AVEN_267099-1 [Araneus ventricosus]
MKYYEYLWKRWPHFTSQPQDSHSNWQRSLPPSGCEEKGTSRCCKSCMRPSSAHRKVAISDLTEIGRRVTVGARLVGGSAPKTANIEGLKEHGINRSDSVHDRRQFGLIALESARKLSITKPGYREIISTEQYSAIMAEVSKKIPAEDESEALYLNIEVTEYNDQETDSENDVEDNLVHEEYSDSNSNTNAYITMHSTSNPLSLLYHKNKVAYN